MLILENLLNNEYFTNNTWRKRLIKILFYMTMIVYLFQHKIGIIRIKFWIFSKYIVQRVIGPIIFSSFFIQFLSNHQPTILEKPDYIDYYVHHETKSSNFIMLPSTTFWFQPVIDTKIKTKVLATIKYAYMKFQFICSYTVHLVSFPENLWEILSNKNGWYRLFIQVIKEYRIDDKPLHSFSINRLSIWKSQHST